MSVRLRASRFDVVQCPASIRVALTCFEVASRAGERIEVRGTYTLSAPAYIHSPKRAILTDVPHSVIRRRGGLCIERERKEATVRAFTPLQVHVISHVVARDFVGGVRQDTGTKGRCGRHCRAGKLNTDSAVPGEGVVSEGALDAFKAGMFGEAWYTYVIVSLGPAACTHEIHCPAFRVTMLTGEVAGPIRMRISCEDNRVTDLVVVEMIKDAVAVRAVAIPGILSRHEFFRM